MLIGIDPSPTVQSCVVWDRLSRRVLEVRSFSFPEDQDQFLEWVGLMPVAVEWIESYGMPVGKEVFQTVFQIGQIAGWLRRKGSVRLIPRKDVKLSLCGFSRAKDPNVRQSLLDAIGPVGTKKAPGPLYGVSSHYWAALGVAYVASEICPTDSEATFHRNS
jgi:hypothetical protein